jgi:type I restriction enzyme S subunit
VFPGFDIPVLPGAFVIRFRFKKGLLSEFVRRYFNWETGRERVLRKAEGGVQKNLRGSTLLKLLIAVPVEGEQREILRRLDAHESRIRVEEGYRDKLKLQKQGLMHDLLTGQVRVTSVKPVKEDTSQLAALTTASPNAYSHLSHHSYQ